MTAILPSRPRLCLRIILFRLGAILLAALIMQTVLKGGQFIAKALLKAGPDAFYVGWIYLCLAIVFQGLLAFIGILIMRRTLPQAEDHVRWPPGRSYAGLAVLIGLGMGLTMLVVDYAPALLSWTAPDASYDLSSVPAAGVLFGMLTTGFAEETLFRGLLVGMLAVLVPGRVRLAGIDLPVAAYIVAVMFGVAHWESFLTDPLHLAIGQQLYAFAWGLIYVWLMERSKSLLAPIIAHGIGNFTEVAIIMTMMATLPAAG